MSAAIDSHRCGAEGHVGPCSPEIAPDSRAQALSKILSGFDDLAEVVVKSSAKDKYHVLRRVAEQAANAQRALGAESLKDFDGGLEYAGDGVNEGFAPLRPMGIADFPMRAPPSDVYRELIGLAKPYLEQLLEQAKAQTEQAKKLTPVPTGEFVTCADWTYEVERLSAIRHSFAPGSKELLAVDVRISDLVRENVKPKEELPCPTA